MAVVEDWRKLLDHAHESLRATAAGVPRAAWHDPTPCRDWDVTQVFQHAVGDQQGYTAFITGGPTPAEDPFAPSGKLDGDPQSIVDDALKLSADAWATVADDAEQVPVPLPQGPMPAWLAAGACALDAGVHAWDIAVATGQRSPLTPEVSEQLMAVARQIVEPLRAYGAYGPALDPGPAAGATEKLLAYLGRRPDWTAFAR